ncbi:hypothetical protein O7607_09200 [Micromonospora sp. WMMA1949]|uniref:hypothetical protein n=1 Tax=unclassified Micromonospora TaxID=2617518 RepID=UPI0022B6CFB7|nr:MULTISPECIES: hypothetical protein [unclassified Micromonospora]MCZ7425906.1 hypothetical protein [Micromonospora sp. WMMA1949]WBC10425.1 hypothetical protein O7604_05990 [Micromonospora sp. WMMA1947]
MTTPSGGSRDDETWRRPEGHDPDRTDDPTVTAGQPEPRTTAADRAVAGGIDTAGAATGAAGATGAADTPEAAGAADTPEAAEAAETPEAAGNASPWSREAATESPWARPEAAGGWTVAGGAWPGSPGGGPPPSGYAGPPPSTPPPPGWRPPVHVQPSPPRRLPPQDMAAMDQAEQRAQRLTYGIGAAVAVVLVLLTCLLCSRVLF